MKVTVYSFRQNTRTWQTPRQTDRQTDERTRHRPCLCIVPRVLKRLSCRETEHPCNPLNSWPTIQVIGDHPVNWTFRELSLQKIGHHACYENECSKIVDDWDATSNSWITFQLYHHSLSDWTTKGENAFMAVGSTGHKPWPVTNVTCPKLSTHDPLTHCQLCWKWLMTVLSYDTPDGARGRQLLPVARKENAIGMLVKR